MKVLSQDRNWLKIIGIIVVLSITLLFSQCSQGFIYRSQTNAQIAVQVICQEQIHNYEWSGNFLEDIEGQGRFSNPYPEFYSHATQYVGEKAFHYATSKSPHLKSYVGLVVGFSKTTQPMTSQSDSAISRQRDAIAIVCETTKPGTNPANDPGFDSSTLTCGSQTRQVVDLLT